VTGGPGARTAVAGAVLLAASVAVMWALGRPQTPAADTAVRTVADCAAVVTLGAAVVPWLDDAGRRRAELVERAGRPLLIGAAVWLLAELARLVVQAARAAGRPATTVEAATVIRYATDTTLGRSVVFSLVCATLVAVLATAATLRGGALLAATAGVAAAGLCARTLSGHLIHSPLGGAAIAVHALAAALWCGVLAALLLTVGHRGRWARVLPRFSQLSLWCVAALSAGGVAGAVVALDAPSDLVFTGYGRVLMAKLALTAGLLVLGWRNRTDWLPAARRHHATAAVSRTRALTELAVMGAALTGAAALTVTG